jgi:isoleucyl-tRNA synthetase
MDYKETLLLPHTTFPMRGNLTQKESQRYAHWDQEDMYARMQRNRSDASKCFTLHDGPPYANGHLHIGHALNKILKDMIVKYHYFKGSAVSYVPGWDCHGLPIEQQVEKTLGKTKKELLPITEIRALCREHAAKFIKIQCDSFKQLGIIGDWKNPYKTMDFHFEANIYRALVEIAKKGLLLERSKPVHWSWACATALAEAEVEYEEKESDSIYVAFDLSDDAKRKIGVKGDASLVIWTTTPWTLPANTAIALNPDERYVVSHDGHIVAHTLHDSLVKKGIVNAEILTEIKAIDLEYEMAINPLNARNSMIVMGKHVAMSDGTGVVHTAPGHGEDDYQIGLHYDLPVIMPVDDKGRYDETVVRERLLPNPESFVGRHVFECNQSILTLLQDKLLHASRITHAYPHCWRSHQPVIFRATKQWFIALDIPLPEAERTLRDLARDEVNRTTFYPKHGINRLSSMVENRPDWCISRQRDWGVPIAFFRDKHSGEVVLDPMVLDHVARIFEQEGCDAWWQRDIVDLLPLGCGLDANQLEKVEDILDVWFDSGSTWKAVLQSDHYAAGQYPAEMYLEGSDQHRGWFQSSLLVSTAIHHHAPYKAILTHGFTVDEKGEKMSKSKGNVVAPSDVLKQFGSEILRLWVAMSDYSGDLKISPTILKQISEQYRKLRNTIRFLMANCSDLESCVSIDQLGVLDRWIMHEAKQVLDEVEHFFEMYEFSKGFSLVNHFVVNDLSGIYLDICKDRLYCDAKTDLRRRASQSAMAMITQSLFGLLAPVLTYTIDEALEHAPHVIKQDVNCVFDMIYMPLPEVASSADARHLKKIRECFYENVDRLKKEKVIKSALELHVQTDSDVLLELPSCEREDWLLVSCVEERKGGLNPIESFTIEESCFEIYISQAYKCPRCWKYKASQESHVCARCEDVVRSA